MYFSKMYTGGPMVSIRTSLAASAIVLCLLLTPLMVLGDQGTEDAPMDVPAPPPKPTGFGPYPQGYINVQIDRPTYIPVAARIYYPAASSGYMTPTNTSGAPWSTIIFIPGGNGGLSYCNAISSRIASYGFVVVNVELGNMYGNSSLRNPYTMADETSYVINYIENQTANASFHLYQMMDKDRIGVSGHSWGGAASGLAATDNSYGDPRFKAAFPISSTPVSNPTDYSKDIHIPLGLMTGTSGDNNLQPLFMNSNPPTHYIRVVGATHGGVLSHSAWPVSFFKYWFENETEYEYWTYTDGIRAEDDAGTIIYSSKLYSIWGNISSLDVGEDEVITYSAGYEGLTYGTVEMEWNLDGMGTWDWSSNITNVTEFSFENKGDYSPSIRISDMYESYQLSFDIHVSNIAPVVTAGENMSAVEDGSVHFSAEGSYDTPSDNDSLEYAWDFGDGEGTDYSASFEADHTYTEAGLYEATVTVRDDDGDETIASVWTNVSNLAPEAHAMDDVLTTEDSLVDFTGSGNDTATDLEAGLTFEWDFGDGNSTEWQDTPVASHVYVQQGNYTATLSVKDIDGDITTDTAVVTVQNLFPVGNIVTPMDGEAFPKDQSIEFQAFYDDTPSDLPWVETYWDMGDGTVVDWGHQVVVQHTYTSSGEYVITFKVRDQDGFVTVVESNVTIYNEAPIISELAPESGRTFDEDSTVKFTVEALDTPSDQDNLTFTWTVDGTQVDGAEMEHTFTRNGEFDVLVNVTDPEGAYATGTIIVKVSNVPVVPSASADRTNVFVGDAVNFTSSVVDTPSDLADMQYEWDFGDGTPTSSEAHVVHSFADPGVYNVELTVTDNGGGTSTGSLTITVKEKKMVEPPKKDDGDKGLDAMLVEGIVATIVIVVIVIVVMLVMRMGIMGREEGPPVSETTPGQVSYPEGGTQVEDGPDDKTDPSVPNEPPPSEPT